MPCLNLQPLDNIKRTRTRPWRCGSYERGERRLGVRGGRHRVKGKCMSPSPNSALEASVLVLNKLFMAVHIISVRRAFCLLCKDLAEVVSLEDGQFATYNFDTWREVSEYRAQHFRQEDDDWVRTVTSEIQVPRVIRLVGYDKLPKQT